EQLAAVAVGSGNDLGDRGYGREKPTVRDCALEGVARTLQIHGDFAPASLPHPASHHHLCSHDVSGNAMLPSREPGFWPLGVRRRSAAMAILHGVSAVVDRKSTRLNSSHVSISYAVFC